MLLAISVRVLSAPILPSSVVRVSSQDTASMSSPRRSGGIRTTSSRWTRWYMKIGRAARRVLLFRTLAYRLVVFPASRRDPSSRRGFESAGSVDGPPYLYLPRGFLRKHEPRSRARRAQNGAERDRRLFRRRLPFRGAAAKPL